jgi:hypothetical protein
VQGPEAMGNLHGPGQLTAFFQRQGSHATSSSSLFSLSTRKLRGKFKPYLKQSITCHYLISDCIFSFPDLFFYFSDLHMGNLKKTKIREEKGQGN